MESTKLTVEYRASSGKGEARKLRSTGRIPAVLYGHHEKPLSISLGEQDFRRILRSRGETAIIGLMIEGDAPQGYDAIIKEIQQHPATGKILHIDFQQVRSGEKIKIEVPVELAGDPVGVKDMGGVLEHGPRQLSIRCVSSEIPDRLVVDVRHLKVRDAIHVRDIALSYPGFEFLDDPDTTLAIVVSPRVEAEPVPAEAAAEAAAEPEVIGKGKEEAEGEAEGESK
jgi:large subunit ribosomal protein L25